MKIIKFKKSGKDKYKVFLENNEVITLYEEVILKNNLLLTKEINEEILKEIDKENNKINAYNMALNYLSARVRSKKEIYNYLLKKGLIKDDISFVIDKLTKEGYINDHTFAKAYIHDQLNFTNNGPYKIKNNLLELGVSKEITEELISDIDDKMVFEKLKKLVQKKLNSTNSGSLNMIRTKILNYFYNLGYDKESVLEILNLLDKEINIEALQKLYDKFYIKYSKKYNDMELKYIIEQKLYAKGYTKEDISKIKREF